MVSTLELIFRFLLSLTNFFSCSYNIKDQLLTHKTVLTNGLRSNIFEVTQEGFGCNVTRKTLHVL